MLFRTAGSLPELRAAHDHERAGRSRSGRMNGLLASLRTPRGLITVLLLLVLAILPLLTQAFDQRYLLSIGTRIVIWAIAAISLNMILGYGGLVSFGHAMFFGIGGYAVGILAPSRHRQRLDPVAGRASWPPPCGPPLIGALSLRTRGLYFIMITLGLRPARLLSGGGPRSLWRRRRPQHQPQPLPRPYGPARQGIVLLAVLRAAAAPRCGSAAASPTRVSAW